MRIVIQSKKGSFEIGGGSHKTCRLISIDGIGLASKTAATIKFSGVAGNKIIDASANNRVITMLFDVNADDFYLTKILRILQEECEILFFLGGKRRKITGKVLETVEPEAINYRKLYKIAVQFYCEIPYFTDFSETVLSLSTRTDNFPTSFEEGIAYITLPAVATTRTATVKIINFGDERTYPKITVIALEASSVITISNQTTGNEVVLSKAISQGEEIVFDFAERRITSSISGSVINNLTDASLLDSIYLDCGTNEMLVTNGEENNISTTISYSNLYAAVII